MSRKKIFISQSNYIPWKGYFDAIAQVDEFVVYDDLQFTRRDWRNRNLIKTSHGLKWLTIPVKVKGKYLQKINETEVDGIIWAEKHFDSLCHAYRRAACFKQELPWLESLYTNANDSMLSDINLHFLKAVLKKFGISTSISFSSNFELLEERNERLISICLQAGASIYYTGPAAQTYLNETLFGENGIEVRYLSYDGYSPYPQLHPPFEHKVSALDIILNLGADAKQALKSFSPKLKTV